MKRTLVLALLLCTLVITGCEMPWKPAETGTQSQTDTEAEPQTTETESETESETEEQTTEPITETEAPTETETEAVTEPPEPEFPAVIEDDGKSDLTALIAPIPEGKFVNPLSGHLCSEEQALLRPVSVMINNVKPSLPQQHVADADIIYECQVEGGLTRLLAVYNNYQNLTAIGSIRSAREYYIDFAANHDAVFVHAGGSDSAYVNLKSRHIDNLDGVNDGSVGGLVFYRDAARRQMGMSLEHTLVADGETIDAGIAKKKYRQTYAENFESPLHFVGDGQAVSLPAGSDAKEVNVSFISHKAAFTYDAEKNVYLRSQNGQPHIEGTTKEQLAYENVIVLVCKYTYTNDDLNHILVADTGSGSGYYFTGGKYMPITWSKKSGDTAFSLTYPDGRNLYLTPGKTFIEIIAKEKDLTVTG